MVVWLIGLSGAGKTTIGRHLYEQWKKLEKNTAFIDGDEIRRIFNHDRHPDAYTISGRAMNADRIYNMCLWLDRQQINVVCSILSIFADKRLWNRRDFSKYFEVYIHVPMDIIIARDQRNLYKQALCGETKNVVGVDIPFAPPESPDMIIDNSQNGLDHSLLAKDILNRAQIFTK